MSHLFTIMSNQMARYATLYQMFSADVKKENHKRNSLYYILVVIKS